MKKFSTDGIIRYLLFLLLVIIACNGILEPEKDKSSQKKQLNDEEKLSLLLDSFESTVNSSEGDSLKKLYIETTIPLIEIIKRRGGPTIDVGTGGGFANRISGFSNVNLNITDRNYLVLNDIAVSTAKFTCCGSTRGTDLFFYIKQDQDWKISTMNVTNQFGANNDDSYVSNPEPQDLIDSLLTSINTSQSEKFIGLFQDNSIRVFIDENSYQGIKPDSLYNKAISEEWCLETHPDSIDAKVVDNYMFYDYQNVYNITDETYWDMLISFVLSETKGWRISSLIIRK